MNWTDETQVEFEQTFWQTKDRWQNRNDRYEEEHDELRPARGIINGLLIGIPVTAASVYFIGWWVIPFIRALLRAL